MTGLLYVLGVLFVVLGVGLSIGLHEIGHLVPAKKFGVKVTQYMVGFGPTVWSTKRGETEYGLKAIPLGGYIRMIGMFPPRPGDKPGTLRVSSTGRFTQLADEARPGTFPPPASSYAHIRDRRIWRYHLIRNGKREALSSWFCRCSKISRGTDMTFQS